MLSFLLVLMLNPTSCSHVSSDVIVLAQHNEDPSVLTQIVGGSIVLERQVEFLFCSNEMNSR